MTELPEVTQLILKHLPPSAGLPKVRPLDDSSRRWCLVLEQQGGLVLGEEANVDATVAMDLGLAREAWAALRPNGRAIFLLPPQMRPALEPSASALRVAGFVRILTETVLTGAFILARGERPTVQPRITDRTVAPAPVPSGRVELVEPAAVAQRYAHLHVLVHQHPPSRGWSDLPPATVWQVSTVRNIEVDRVAVPAFTSLVIAVAFMQPAIIAGAIRDINKIPRFEVERVLGWNMPILINPAFEWLRADPRYEFNSPLLKVDPGQAMKSSE